MTTFDPIVTFYSSITDTQKPQHMPLSRLIEGLKSDHYKLKEARQRGVTAEDKKKLPVICFGGQFQERNKSSLINASELLILDFDGKNTQDAIKFRDRLLRSEYVHVLFTSPSGNGVKAVIRIPKVKNDDEFKEYFNALQVKFPDLDKSGKDISRACYFSYDAELHHNPESKVWETKLEAPRVEVDRVNIKNDYGIINRCANVIQNAVPGERHDKIRDASRLAGGFVAAGEIERGEAERILINVANQINPDEPWVNKKTVEDGISNGMLDPILDVHKELKKEELEQKLGKIYYTADDVHEDISDLWINGRTKGYDLYFANANQYISFKPGCTTYIHGQEFSGKSQVFFEFAIQMAHKHNVRFAIFSPETGRAAEIFAEMMQMYVTKDFYESDFRMTEEERDEAYKWVAAYFIVIDPDDKVFTISDFYEYIEIIERVYATTIEFSVIDPWNEFDHKFDKVGRDVYVERELTKVRKNAGSTGRHNVIITHSTSLELLTDKETGVRYYPPATRNQIAQGQAWPRKGHQIITVWRPKFGLKDEHGEPYGKYDSIVINQKAKPKGTGQTGAFKLQYQADKHRYFEPENPDGSTKYNGEANIFATLSHDSRKHIVEDKEKPNIWNDASIDNFESETPF